MRCCATRLCQDSGCGSRPAARGRYIFQYRAGAKFWRTVPGTFGAELTTAQARKKAESLRGQVRDARDPVAERRAAGIAAAKAEAAEKSLTSLGPVSGVDV